MKIGKGVAPRFWLVAWLMAFAAGMTATAGSDLMLGLKGRQSSDPGRSTDRARAMGGREILVAVVVSPACEFSRDPRLPDLVREVEQGFWHRAQDMGLSFAMVGIAVGQSAEDGVELLRGLGAFDEIMSGGSWVNLGVLRYVVEELPGMQAVPQVVVVERTYATNHDALVVGIERERLLARRVGIAEIGNWVEVGMPVSNRREGSS